MLTLIDTIVVSAVALVAVIPVIESLVDSHQRRKATTAAHKELVAACRVEYIRSPEGIRLADSLDRVAAAERSLVQAVQADTAARF